jgi:hypothetical protein
MTLTGKAVLLTGPMDTDMTRGFEIPKATAESVAQAIFDGVGEGVEDIFPRCPVADRGAELAQRHGQGTRTAVRAADRQRDHGMTRSEESL